MRLRRTFLLLLPFAASFAHADELDRAIQAYLDQQHVAGLQFTVMKHGKVVRSGQYGYANLEHRVPVKPETTFEIGSVTKSFTASLVVMQQAAGALKLDSPISDGLENPPAAWKDLTLRQCLTHTAGLPDYLSLGFNPLKTYTPREALDITKDKPLDFPPGANWSYSNSGFMIAGLILESKLKKKWPVLVKEQILDKVPMPSARVLDHSELVPNKAYGYRWDGKKFQVTPPIPVGAAYSAGALTCTSEDLAKWGEAVRSGRFGSLDELWKPAVLRSGRTWEYALGWDVLKLGDKKYVGHGGNTFGFSADLGMLPEEGLVVSVLTNGAGQNLTAITTRILKEFSKLSPPKTKAVTSDPNKARTYRLWDALESALSSKPDPKLIAEEAFYMFSTDRTRDRRTRMRSQMLPIRAMRYISEAQENGATAIVYEIVSAKQKTRLKLMIDAEGRLCRIVRE